jgi:hypothetical protein
MESFDSLGKWRDLIGENADLVAIARTSAEIEAVAASGRTAIVLVSRIPTCSATHPAGGDVRGTWRAGGAAHL